VDRILIIASVTIAAGLILYLRDMNDAGGFGDLLGTHSGVALTIGGVAALAAFLVGLFGTRPNVQRLLALGRQIASSEGPPSPDLTAKVQSLQDLIKTLARTSLGLLGITVVAMATARYW